MKSILSIYDLLPALLLVLQTLIVIAVTISLLQVFKILQLPYAGMEYSKIVLSASFLVSTVAISFSDIEGVVQTVKTFRLYDTGFLSNVLVKFSQYFFVTLLTQLLFGSLCIVIIKVMPGFRQSYSAEEDLPGSIIQGIVFIMVAILLYLCAKEVLTSITPRYINFN